MATRTTGRITIPKNAIDLLALADKIYTKHLADGANSPLLAQQDYNWAIEGPKVKPCKDNHDKAEEAARLSEQYYRQRDLDLPAIKAIVQNTAQVLKGIYAKNPKVLSDYGLEVDDTKQTKKPKPKKDSNV